MRKNYYLSAAWTVCACLTFFCGMGSMCSDDDDEEFNYEDPESNASLITTKDGEGLLLQNVSFSYSDAEGEYDCVDATYDSQARCTQVNSWWYIYNMSCTPFKSSFEQKNDDIDDEGNCAYTLKSSSLNSSGYLSSMSYTVEIDDYDYQETWTMSPQFTYDADGHLTEISDKAKVVGKDEDGKYSETLTIEYPFEWSDGNLVRIDYSEIEYGDTYTETAMTATYSNVKNDYQQYTYLISGALYYSTDLLAPELSLFGFLGKGPSYLPVTVNAGGSTDGASYTKNDNGTINVEAFYDVYGQDAGWCWGYNMYTYCSVDSDTRGTVATPFDASSSSLGNSDLHKRMVSAQKGRLHKLHDKVLAKRKAQKAAIRE